MRLGIEAYVTNPHASTAAEAQKRAVQRPRVFYRRELETNPLIVATRDPLAPQ